MGVLYPWPNLDTVPGLVGVLRSLARQGYLVDVFTHSSPEFNPPAFEDPGVTIRLSRVRALFSALTRSDATEHPWRRARPSLYAALVWLYLAAQMRVNLVSSVSRMLQVRWLDRRVPYRCLVGVDPAGLLEARFLAASLRVPVVYYSLELLFSDEVSNPEERRLKKGEVEASREAAFVVIPDEERARLLAEDNRIPPHRFVLVPNSPEGPARRSPSRYWHHKLGLAGNQRVVLYFGSLGAWTGTEEIIDSVGSWPPNWVLVVHTRYDAETSGYVERLRSRAAPGRVFFSLKPVDRSELESLVDGADLGVAFYVPVAGSTYTRRNIQAIGLSSGKIAHYLRAGLPVIVNSASSIVDLVRRVGCGVAVEEGGSIGTGITRIEQDFEAYSRRACRVFEEYLDPERGKQEVVRRVDLLSRCEQRS